MNVSTEFLASPETYTAGRGGNEVDGIVVHYTGGAGTARQNAIYFSGGNRNASAHYFVDGSGTAYLSVPEGDTAWAVGNFAANQRTISIEVVSDGEPFSRAELDELRELVGDLMRRYGVPAERVMRHYDAYDFYGGLGGGWVDPHKACPAPYTYDGDWKWHEQVWPYIVGGAASSPEPSPSGGIAEDGWWGTDTTRALQRALGTPEDGEVWGQVEANAQPALTSGWVYDYPEHDGSPCIAALQERIGMTGKDVDGVMGPATIACLQLAMGTASDGELWGPSPCVAEMQRRLNAGTFMDKTQ